MPGQRAFQSSDLIGGGLPPGQTDDDADWPILWQGLRLADDSLFRLVMQLLSTEGT